MTQLTWARPDRWRWRNLWLAPYRLGFFLATVLLGAAALWWAQVQLDRSGLGPGLRYALSPSLVHAAVMTFGFMPLFFAGFLFTAGPRWLAVPAPPTRRIAAALLAQAAGWLLWLAASHVHASAATAGPLLAAVGLSVTCLQFWRLVRASSEGDRLHARIVGGALAFGCVCLAGLAISVAANWNAAARAFVLSGLWGFVIAVFATVADRMIPFFAWPPPPAADTGSLSALWLTIGLAVFEALLP